MNDLGLTENGQSSTETTSCERRERGKRERKEREERESSLLPPLKILRDVIFLIFIIFPAYVSFPKCICKNYLGFFTEPSDAIVPSLLGLYPFIVPLARVLLPLTTASTWKFLLVFCPDMLFILVLILKNKWNCVHVHLFGKSI